MDKTQVYVWHKRFCDDRASVNDDARCVRPSTATKDENIENVRRKFSIQEITAEVETSVGRVNSIL
jgi:hypothetical protein